MRTPYFDSLIDDFSIWQHADGIQPLPEHGYALDDATRALLLCLALKRTKQSQILFDFLCAARRGDDFYGFYNAARQPIQFPASEDAKGQVIWAFGYAVSQGFNADRARAVLDAVRPSVAAMSSLRGPAYALLGAVYIDKQWAAELYEHLSARFAATPADWLWPEPTITYANGLLPYSFLRYALVYNDEAAADLGRRVLTFLEASSTQGRIRGPVGNHGWFTQGDRAPAENGQQPIDVAYMLWAWLAAYQLSHNPADLAAARAWMQWFEGTNIAGAPMYDPATLKAYDGIDQGNPDHHEPNGRNLHSGAESNICFLLSRYLLDHHATL